MTPDHLDDRPEESPAPPASTRWEGDAVEDDADLMPPYVPGRAGSERVPSETREPAPRGSEPTGSEPPEPYEPERYEPAPSEPEPPGSEPTETAPEPFPFDTGYAEPAAADDPARSGGEPDEFPFDAFEIEGEPAERSEEPEPRAEAEPEGAAGDPWSPDGWSEQWADPDTEEAVSEVEPPVDDFMVQETAPAAGGPGPMVEPESDAPVGDDAQADAVVAELASRLEQLAGSLRREGEGALERESREGDRLGSVLAGLLSGYLAGRGRP